MKTLLLLLASASTLLGNVSVNFLEGIWDFSSSGGVTNSTGWDSQYTTGTTTLTLSQGGVINVTLTQVGVGTVNIGSGTGEFNDIGMAINNSASSTGSVSLTNYQAWQFSFSTAVDSISWQINDIDAGNGWYDGVAVEGWTSTAGAIGTGVAADWDITGTDLEGDYFFSPGIIEYVRQSNGAIPQTFTELDPDASAEFTIESSGLTGFTLYVFNSGSTANATEVFGEVDTLMLGYE